MRKDGHRSQKKHLHVYLTSSGSEDSSPSSTDTTKPTTTTYGRQSAGADTVEKIVGREERRVVQRGREEEYRLETSATNIEISLHNVGMSRSKCSETEVEPTPQIVGHYRHPSPPQPVHAHASHHKRKENRQQAGGNGVKLGILPMTAIEVTLRTSDFKYPDFMRCVDRHAGEVVRLRRPDTTYSGEVLHYTKHQLWWAVVCVVPSLSADLCVARLLSSETRRSSTVTLIHSPPKKMIAAFVAPKLHTVRPVKVRPEDLGLKVGTVTLLPAPGLPKIAKRLQPLWHTVQFTIALGKHVAVDFKIPTPKPTKLRNMSSKAKKAAMIDIKEMRSKMRIMKTEVLLAEPKHMVELSTVENPNTRRVEYVTFDGGTGHVIKVSKAMGYPDEYLESRHLPSTRRTQAEADAEFIGGLIHRSNETEPRQRPRKTRSRSPRSRKIDELRQAEKDLARMLYEHDHQKKKKKHRKGKSGERTFIIDVDVAEQSVSDSVRRVHNKKKRSKSKSKESSGEHHHRKMHSGKHKKKAVVTEANAAPAPPHAGTPKKSDGKPKQEFANSGEEFERLMREAEKNDQLAVIQNQPKATTDSSRKTKEANDGKASTTATEDTKKETKKASDRAAKAPEKQKKEPSPEMVTAELAPEEPKKATDSVRKTSAALKVSTPPQSQRDKKAREAAVTAANIPDPPQTRGPPATTPESSAPNPDRSSPMEQQTQQPPAQPQQPTGDNLADNPGLTPLRRGRKKLHASPSNRTPNEQGATPKDKGKVSKKRIPNDKRREMVIRGKYKRSSKSGGVNAATKLATPQEGEEENTGATKKKKKKKTTKDKNDKHKKKSTGDKKKKKKRKKEKH